MTDREKFEAWFRDIFMSGMDDAGEFDEERNCYVTFQVHMAHQGYMAGRKQMAEEAALEIELGKVALRFSDRAGDVCAEIDPADRICAEFYAAVSEVFERHYPSRRSLATPTEGKT